MNKNIFLCADIGGTNARLALFDAHKTLIHQHNYEVKKYPNLSDVVDEFLQAAAMINTNHAVSAGFAVAGPVRGDRVEFSNSKWYFSKSEIQHRFNFQNLIVVNDFAANALAISTFEKDDLDPIINGNVFPESPAVIIGSGTGLGIAISPHHNAFASDIMPSQGGHVLFAPAIEQEIALEGILRRNGVTPIMDNILSGKGLQNIHAAWRELDGRSWQIMDDRDISKRAHEELEQGILGDARKAFRIFSGILGTFAANMALVTIPYGGVYLTGGVLQKNKQVMDWAYFVDRFQRHPTMAALLKEIPVFLVKPEIPAFPGLLAAMSCNAPTA